LGRPGERDHSRVVRIATSTRADTAVEKARFAARPGVVGGRCLRAWWISRRRDRAWPGASKAAVKLLTEGLHSECAGTNVHITVVFPGAVATNITTNSGVAIPVSAAQAEAAARRTLIADKAARIILDGIEKDAYRVMVGNDAKLMDRLYRLNPRSAGAWTPR
jgi:NAD(P)-dependent dehydrogenase (short-subunit alcohol dehydrogenase family)